MRDVTMTAERAELDLPAGAPQVRVSAGVGSAHQKTWNLRRPVTLIGSARPAHIILHDNDVSKAHCVIVNTGHDILLKDLCTSSGTFCNKQRVDLVALEDGDEITVGTTRIQVAINASEAEKDDSSCGLQFVEPTKFPKPLIVRMLQTDMTWKLEEAVALIGRHASAAVRLDHVDTSTRHAVLFRFAQDVGVFDLGSRTGIAVNGAECAAALIRPGDRLTVGPLTLAVGCLERPEVESQASSEPVENIVPELTSQSLPVPAGDAAPDVPPMPPKPGPSATTPRTSAGEPAAPREGGSMLAQIEGELAALQRNIGDSWERLNQWQEQLRQDAQRLDNRDAGLETRSRELDAKDAALRGQLHDLTRYHEQITAREQELAAELARMQGEFDKLTASQADLVRREGDLAKRTDELQRREHVLAQRWARLLAAACPHCGKPVRPATDKD